MKTHVVIIGAGPSGLAAAYCLNQCAISYTLLEQCSAPLGAIANVDAEMLLLSPTCMSLLPGMKAPLAEYLNFGIFRKMLEDYMEKHHICVTTSARVTLVESSEDHFIVHYSGNDKRHSLKASHIINATGIISHPRLPQNFSPDLVSFPWKHSIDIRRCDLEKPHKLVVIGGGISAGGILEQWLEIRKPQQQAWISLQSKLRYVNKFFLGIDIHYFTWLFEHFPTRFLKQLSHFREPMFSKKVPTATKKNIITCIRIISYKENKVIFKDGQITPDLVIFATGFYYNTDHLSGLLQYDRNNYPVIKACQSVDSPRLYFLGIRGARTFASPYIRGISRDALYISQRIAKEVRQ